MQADYEAHGGGGGSGGGGDLQARNRKEGLIMADNLLESDLALVGASQVN